jgi:hypothetical protein
VLVMDNASIHKVPGIREMVLRPWGPHRSPIVLSRIEPHWAFWIIYVFSMSDIRIDSPPMFVFCLVWPNVLNLAVNSVQKNTWTVTISCTVIDGSFVHYHSVVHSGLNLSPAFPWAQSGLGLIVPLYLHTPIFFWSRRWSTDAEHMESVHQSRFREIIFSL